MKEVRSIAIVGGGELAATIRCNAGELYNKIDIIDHNKFDITNQGQCDAIIPQLATYDAVIITAGTISTDLWSMWLTNTVGPCYLIAKLNATASGQRIIAISSHGASWTSWPDISIDRLNYNTSKSALNMFLNGMVHQGTSTNKITVFEPSRFKTRMSNYQGANVTDIAQQVLEVIDSPMHIIHVIVKE